jgi:hypothetical protein
MRTEVTLAPHLDVLVERGRRRREFVEACARFARSRWLRAWAARELAGYAARADGSP